MTNLGLPRRTSHFLFFVCQEVRKLLEQIIFNLTQQPELSTRETQLISCSQKVKCMMYRNDSNCSQVWQNITFSQMPLTSITGFQLREETIFGRFGENQETKNLKSLMPRFS